MADARKEFGFAGESLAASVLVRAGMRVLERNARTAFGEIDLVCEDGDELAFVEVKSRQGGEYGYPEEAITASKYRHMAASAEAWMDERKMHSRLWRLDVVAIRAFPGEEPEVVHLKAIDRPS